MAKKGEKTLLFKIILPSDTVAEINATMVVIPGQEGVFSVLPGHMKFISNINPGIVDVYKEGGIEKFFVYGGVALVTGTEISIVTEFAANLATNTKSFISDKITELHSELSNQEKDSIESKIISIKIEKYQAALEFIK
jgi:F-type H+-transporting ATPase subunit epsilon